MKKERPYVLSIAGHDPSGGAGITADVKAFEMHKTQGFSVATALTFQNENEFKAVTWVDVKDILLQVDLLFDKHQIDFVKIGLIESLDTLHKIVVHLKKLNPSVRIIWDPITSASAGFIFHDTIQQEKLYMICDHLYLVTPNADEIQKMMPQFETEHGAKQLSAFCNVLLKGGHNSDDEVKDILFQENGLIVLGGTRSQLSKHGTGCVLSASILANMANGLDLNGACKDAKHYIERFINSNETLLGYHLN